MDFKTWAVISGMTQFVISFIFFVARLMDGASIYVCLAKFSFAWSVGFILCMLAYLIAAGIMDTFNQK